jgi:hypothetical protein
MIRRMYPKFCANFSIGNIVYSQPAIKVVIIQILQNAMGILSFISFILLRFCNLKWDVFIRD